MLTAVVCAFAVFGSVAAQEPAPGTVVKNPKTNAEMVFIPSGEFTMGSDKADDEKPIRKVNLTGFWMGKTPVTVAQFKAYCDATSTEFKWQRRMPTWGWKDDHPMVNVTWDEARAYCKWAGGDLPTEAQFEKAARGTDAREYPWGNDWDATKCVSSAAERRKSTAPAGSIPSGASPYGCLDMAGNVWHWCLDWYAESYDKNQLKDPTGPESGKCRVIRGANWFLATPAYFRTCHRSFVVPTAESYNRGFRVACPAGALK